MTQQQEQLQRTGRGGAGNFRRASNDPENTSTAKSIIKDIKASLAHSPKVEYVHHGRGGAGNLSTTSTQVTPVQSVVDENVPLKTKPFIGRGGAGNVRSISNERSSAERRSGNVVSVPGTEAGAQVEGEKIAEPEQAHLCEGREVVSGDDDRIV